MSTIREAGFTAVTNGGTGTNATVNGGSPGPAPGTLELCWLLVANGTPANIPTPAGWQLIAQRGFDTSGTPTDTLGLYAKVAGTTPVSNVFQSTLAVSAVWAGVLVALAGVRICDHDGASLTDCITALAASGDTANLTLTTTQIEAGTAVNMPNVKSLLSALGTNGANTTMSVSSVGISGGATADAAMANSRLLAASGDVGSPSFFPPSWFTQFVWSWTATNRRSGSIVAGVQDAPSLSLCGMGC